MTEPGSERVGQWIEEVNAREIPDQPLRWVRGRFHASASLAHVYNEEHPDNEISVHQMAAAMRSLWGAGHEFCITVARKDGYRVRWQVLRADGTDPDPEYLPQDDGPEVVTDGGVDVDRLRSEAEVASGFGTREQVEPAEWLPDDLTVGDVIRVVPDGDIDPFEGTVRGISKDRRFHGSPVVRSTDVPAEIGTPHVAIAKNVFAGVVADAE